MTRKDSTKKKFQAINDKGKLFQSKVLIGIVIVLFLAVLCNFVCYFHSSRSDAHLFADRLARTQVVSSFDFSYESELETELRRKSVEATIMPSYKISNADILIVDKRMESLNKEITEIASIYTNLSEQDKQATKLFDEYSAILMKESGFDISPEDLKALILAKENSTFDRFFNLASYNFKDISDNGIFADDGGNFIRRANSVSKRESAAKKEFRDRINILGFSSDLSNIGIKLFSQYLRPNLDYDEETTLAKKKEASDKVSTVVVNVREGEVLTDPSVELTPIMKEKLAAYRSERIKRSDLEYSTFGSLSDFVISIFLISAATLFIVVSKNPKTRKKQTIFSFLVLFFCNLGALRILIDGLDKANTADNTPLLLVFAYALPILVAPLIQVLIAGAYTGFVMSLLLSSFATLMLGESVEYFIIIFVASLIAIYYCANARTRSRILTGGFFCGLAIAFGCMLTGIAAQSSLNILLTQSLTAIVSAMLCGLLAMLLLPLIERIFNVSSNITLFELTNFNRPLLYKLQVAAPATFHHCIMVAQIAENAAKAIKANDLLCRVGGLYHDIGKLSKPEFFTENQRGISNPHDTQSPSMSALIIKNHVKEGIEIAKMSKLPKVVIDMVSEHHGTTLIKFFYSKALKLKEESLENSHDGISPVDVEESTYRYDESKPRSTESTILMLADSCEAASRSLKKISPHSIEELISAIVNDKMADGQLDNSPVTVRQLSTIKASFAFTILNMNHSRVEYPDSKKPIKK